MFLAANPRLHAVAIATPYGAEFLCARIDDLGIRSDLTSVNDWITDCAPQKRGRRVQTELTGWA